MRFDRREALRFLAIAAFLVGIAALICRSHPRASGALGPVIVGGTNFIFERTRRRGRTTQKDPPGMGDAFEVRVTIRNAHGLRTGSDCGWLILSEGWVLFEGARTDFAVTRGESYRRTHSPTLSLKLEDGRTVEFRATGQPPIPKQLNRAFNAWEMAPIPEGDAVFPPREIHPDIWVERHGLCVVGLIVSLTSVAYGTASGLGVVALLGLIASGACLWAGRAYAERVRLAIADLSSFSLKGNPSLAASGGDQKVRDPEGLVTDKA